MLRKKKKNQVYFTKNLQPFSRDLISLINESQQVRKQNVNLTFQLQYII